MPTINNGKNKLIMFMLDYLASTSLSNNECVNIINTINELDNETTLINYVIDVLLDTNASSSDVDRIARLLSWISCSNFCHKNYIEVVKNKLNYSKFPNSWIYIRTL